jgi:hypothetical protein
VGRVASARALGRLADGLRDAGVRHEIAGPRIPRVSIGPGVRSGTGRWTTGSSAPRPGGLRTLGPLVLSDLRSRPAARTAALAVLGAAVAALVAAAVRGR